MTRIRLHFPVVVVLLVVGVFRLTLGFTIPCNTGYRDSSSVKVGLCNRCGLVLGDSSRVYRKLKNVNYGIEPSPLPMRGRDVVVTGLNAEASGGGGGRDCKLRGRFVGVGSCTPEVSLSNNELEGFMDTSDEWIRTRTGIGNRKLLGPSSKLVDLAAEAGKRAIADAGIKAEDIDIVILASSTPDDLFGDAASIAKAVGCKRGVVAFDLTAACSGFVFAAVTAGHFLTAGTYRTALVLGADALSRWVDWKDRNTCILFGDGAGATVMVAANGENEAAGKNGLLGFAMHSDGAGHENLAISNSGEELELMPGKIVTKGEYSPISMNGREVYRFATKEVPLVLTEALKNGGLTVDDVDWLLLHQANVRIMDAVAKRLGIPSKKILSNLGTYGNTSAGSIPLALDEAVKEGKVKRGDIVACAGFGAGLSWGGLVFRWGG